MFLTLISDKAFIYYFYLVFEVHILYNRGVIILLGVPHNVVRINLG